MIVEARRPEIISVINRRGRTRSSTLLSLDVHEKKTKKRKQLRSVNLSNLRRNREFVEAEQSNGGVNCDWSIESCIRYMFEKYT